MHNTIPQGLQHFDEQYAGKFWAVLDWIGNNKPNGEAARKQPFVGTG